MAPMQNFRLRVMREADLPQVRELNDAAAPAINPLTEEELTAPVGGMFARLGK